MNKVDYYFMTALAAILACSLSFELMHEPSLHKKACASQEVHKVPEPKSEPEPEGEGCPVNDRPDFAAIADVEDKKHAFFYFIHSMVEAENHRLLMLRRQVVDYQSKSTLDDKENQWLLDMARQYRIDNVDKVTEALFTELLTRVDAIPESLAMVQAANESAWGTSRFALDANNYFGQWCFTEGCGIVPAQRPEGATYEVEKFDSPEASVRSYMNNLNTSRHYSELRHIRAHSHVAGEPVTGTMLAEGLHAYSQRGQAYVEELVLMINGNNLLQYDLKEK